MTPPTTADLVFSAQANHNFSRTLGELKRSTLSIYNRLRSIQADAVFAEAVADVYNLPLIANERCGSWYIEPQSKAGSVYFKSTDGHTGVWKFSTRRLNLHLLQTIGASDGCIIVDSTRRGKRMPDALSKTIPIWCSVLNRLLFPESIATHDLHTPPQVVSDSEHAQMAALLPSFLESVKALEISTVALRSLLKKPLRPLWITHDSNMSKSNTAFEDFHPVICCTVSRRVAGGEASEGGYIQGAADDTENWAHGLTPAVFWANKDRLLSAPEAELPSLIKELNSSYLGIGDSRRLGLRCVQPTGCLYVGSYMDLTSLHTIRSSVMISLLPQITPESAWRTSPTTLEVGIGTQKMGSRNLRVALPIITDFVQTSLSKPPAETLSGACRPINITCESGKDHSIGVALVLLCVMFDDDGKLLTGDDVNQHFDKVFIRRRLSWLYTSMPDVNPSRATLQSVNNFLMDRRL